MLLNIINSHPSTDGDGVKIRRIHGFGRNRLDPFLMLDEISSDNPDDYSGGFPPHPHRGIETLTYIRQGGFMHRDSMGNKGEITSGGVQWMSAGRGVIHSEMPTQKDGTMHGFQIWINLAARHKMKQPEYQDVSGDEVTNLQVAEARLQLLTGSLQINDQHHSSRLTQVSAGASIASITGNIAGLHTDHQPHTAIGVYVFKGSVRIGQQQVERGQMASGLTDAATRLEYSGEECGLLLLTGNPIGEPVAHHGPFVMNTEDEIQQAIADYQQGKLAAQPLIR